MHIALILNKVVGYIYKRRLNFLLSLIILTVTLYLLTMAVQMFYNSQYYIFATKRALQNDNIVNINVLFDVMNPDYCEIVKDLDSDLVEEYKGAYGKFMYMTPSYNLSDGREESVQTLYIDASISDLCKLSFDNISQNKVFDDEEVLKGYVGTALKEQYPVGTILTDSHTKSKIEIVAEIEEGTVWLPDLLFYSQDAVVSLDNYIVTEMDNGYFELNSDFYSNIFNSMYIKCSSKGKAEQVKEDVIKRASDMGVMVYCYTLDDLIEQEKEANHTFAREMGFLILFVAIISATAYLSAGLADIYSRHYELAVMYMNHVSSIDLFMMLFVENIIKAAIAIGVSLFLFMRDLADTKLIVFQMLTMPTVICSVLFFMFITTIICYKTVNRRNLLSMIGGIRL